MSKLYVNEIHGKTGPAKALEINSAGIITPTKPIGFTAILDADQSLSNQTYTKLNLKASHDRGFDTESGWSDSNYYYTVPAGAGGYWMFHAHLEMAVTSGATIIVVSKTSEAAGTTANWLMRSYSGDSTTSGNNDGSSCSGIFEIADGDIIKAEGYHSYGSSQVAEAITGYARTWLSGWRLG